MLNIEDAIQMIQSGEVEKGLHILNDLAKESNTQEKLEIAHIYIELGVQDEAKRLLEEILSIEPGNDDAKVLLADILIDDHEDEQAITVLNEINEASEIYLQALLQLADLYQAQGLFEVAEEKLLQAKNKEPEEKIIDFALGELLFSIGEYQKATIYYEKVLQEAEEFGGVNIRARLAECYAINGAFEAAFEHFQSLETDDPETLFRYGFMAFKSERFEIAIQVWESLIEKELEYPSVYLYLAKAYYEEGLIQEAYETAQAGVEMDPYNKEMWLEAGKISLKYGNHERAFEYTEQALTLDTEYQEALLFLVEAYKQHEAYDRIIQVLTEKVELESLDGIFYWELAKAYNEEELFKKALNAYQSAYNKMRADADFLKDYAYFLIEEGRTDKAIDIFQSYLKLEPSDFEVQAFLERLKNQKDTLY
ncbi:tetratricopeptide repeat protein [Gracilibacillus sp. YIM 98692]|uniref:tetratricopeptide repeat protein n=1 Tax=Gracilibacillus sp. YIM 98692 TaxID=2663532 RepID=UPI0013D0DD79|nr:tetratricopeptide repeat protein [Gracilibacillus sp. YIM 98692]